MDRALRRAAGTEALEPAAAQLIDESFAENAARRIARAEDQHVVSQLPAHERGARRTDAGELARRPDGGWRRLSRCARVAVPREKRLGGRREQVQGSHALRTRLVFRVPEQRRAGAGPAA